MGPAASNKLLTARTGVLLVLIAMAIGVLTGAATWLFVIADHLGVKFLWQQLPLMLPGVSAAVVGVGVITVMTALAALVVWLSKGRPFDTGMAEGEYNEHGRIAYNQLIGGVAYSLLSLFSGAAVGPEAALTDINGGLGTFIGDWLGLTADNIKMMAYAGVAGAFAAFFGAAPVGALLAIELLSPKSATISRTSMIAGLASGATAYVTYALLGGESMPLVLTFPGADALTLANLFAALLIGLLGGVIGLVYGAAFMKTRALMAPLRTRPWLAALVGGVAVAVASVFSPMLLFSGQTQIGPIIGKAAALGAIVLIGLGVGKLALSGWSLSTAYFGGPIFPLIFAGTCFGLAMSLLIPGVPQGVAVMAMIGGLVASAAVAPLSVTVFLALIADKSLISVIAIATVAAYVVRQSVAPTMPGVFASLLARKPRDERPAADED
jgi:H+/Cl- antiporter ClcA